MYSPPHLLQALHRWNLLALRAITRNYFGMFIQNVEDSGFGASYKTTDTKEPELANQAVQVFPNPAESDVRVHCSDSESLRETRLLDMTGRIVYIITYADRSNEKQVDVPLTGRHRIFVFWHELLLSL